MSGGHFQYQQDSIMDIAEEIQNVIYNNDDESIDEWGDRRGRGVHSLLRCSDMTLAYLLYLHWLQDKSCSYESAGVF